MAQDLSPLLPEKVKVSYPVRICGGSNSPDGGWPKVYEKTINLSDITFGDATITPQPKGVKDTVFVIRDTALALYSTAAGPPTNQAALDDLAKQVATDFYNFRSIAFTKVYNGVIPVPPNALIDLMEFAYDATEQATRIATQPLSGEATEQQHQDSSVSMCQDFDRNPGIHVDIPGGASGTSMLGVLSLEDGRLVMTYNQTAMMSCTCTPATPPCGSLCVTVIGCNSKAVSGATVTVTTKTVTSIAVTNGGAGYTVAPTVVFATTNGRGAVAVANLTGGVVTSITVTSGGAYSAAPLISFTGGGGGAGAAATATVSTVTVGTGTTTGQITSITRTNAGSGYTGVPTVTISGDGSGATAIANMVAPILSFNVDNAGANYTTAPTANISTTFGAGASARVLLTGTTVNTVAVVSGASYTAIPTVTLTTPGGHTGAGATASAAMGLTSGAVSAAGAGYVVNDLLTVTGGTSSITAVLKVIAVNGTGGVTSVSIDTTGNYTALPANPAGVVGGTGAGATFNLTWRVVAIAVTNGGANYSTAPTVSFSSGAATATASLTPTTIASVTRLAGGSYSATPTVTLSGGGGGTGGAISATLDTFTLSTFTVTNGGTGYTTATATVAAPPMGGTTATGTPVISTFVCIGITSAGNYSITASATNYTTNTSTTSLSTCTTQNVNVGVSPVAGFVCTHGGCCPISEDPATLPFAQHYPPATIFVNDGIGTVTMTSVNPTSNSAVWTGCATRTAGTGIPNCAFSSTTAPNVPVTVFFQLSCTAFGTMLFNVAVGGCGTGANCTGNPPADTMQCNGIPTGSHCQTPYLASIPVTCLPSFSASNSTSGFTSGGSGAGFFYIYGGSASFAFTG